jgi:ABC-type microcin C transport system permease subunit YejB
MQTQSTVEIADRVSRRRAVGVAIAALVFLLVQFVARPFFGMSGTPTTTRIDMWALNAVVLLLLLGTGGGLLNRTQLRVLVNDEVSRLNYKSSVLAGFWTAMTLAMALYLLPAVAAFTGREAIYLIVTASVVVSLLSFSWLELRAHRDG